MSKKEPVIKPPSLYTRKEFLKRMSQSILGVAGLGLGNLIFTGPGSGTARASGDPGLLIQNARLIDGTGQAVQYGASIRIRHGLIDEIGFDLLPDGETVLDVDGATVMPGLIDSHVHLSSVPGAVFRNEDRETIERNVLLNLRSYLAAGITTVLDTGIAVDMLRKIQNYLAAGGIGPKVYALGPMLITPGGYMDDPRFYKENERELFPPAVESREDIVAQMEGFDGLPNILGVKVLIENGIGPWNVWPIHSPEVREIIMEEASARNLPIWVHAMDETEQCVALGMSPRTIAHAGFLTEKVKAEHVARLRDSGVYINSTLTVANLQRGEFHPEWLNTPFARKVIPEEERMTAQNCSAWRQMMKVLYDLVVPEEESEALEGFLYAFRGINNLSQSRNASASLKMMYDAGIPLTLGSDSGNWPIFLNYFHGWSSIVELEYMRKAGMSLEAIVEAATRTPSEMMGLSDRVGTLEPGKCADMIVLREDPLRDVKAYQSLLWTIKDGVAGTPEEWLGAVG